MTAAKTLNLNVHGARGLFAMAVFVFHVVNSGLPTPAWLAGSYFETYFLESLKAGVELFFGISGYVIIGALGRAPTLRMFAWERITRILPVLWASLFVITAMALMTGRALPSLGQWVLNFLTLPPFLPLPQINPAAWSLGYEMTFYALCAGAAWLRGRGVRLWLAIAVAIGALLVVLYPRAILMMSGVAIAAHYLPPWSRRLAAFPFTTLILFLVSWRAIEVHSGTPLLFISPAFMPIGDWIVAVPAILASGLIGTIALQGIVDGPGPFGALLQTRAMQWLGTVSYSFYLWHPVVMAVVKQGMKTLGIVAQAGAASQLLFGIISVIPSLIVAHYSQIYLEARLTRRLRRSLEGNGPRAPATVERDFGDGPTIVDRLN